MQTEQKSGAVGRRFFMYSYDVLGLHEVVAGHFGGLWHPQDMEDGGCHVGQTAVLNGGVGVVGDVYAGHRVERVGCVGRSVGVYGIVRIAVVGDDDGFVAGGFGSFNYGLHAVVDCCYGFLDGVVYAGMAYHVAVGEVYDHEVVFVFADGGAQFVGNLIGAHFGLEVVGGNLGRRNQDTLLAFVGGFAAAVEEEGHVGVFLGFGYVELLFAVVGKVFAEGVLHILLGEEDVHAGKRSVVGGHAVVLQSGQGVHPLFGHVVLGEHYGELLGAVVAVVEEDYHVAGLDGAVDGRVVDGEHEFVGHVGVVALLHGLNHVSGLLAFALHEEIVGHFHAVPAFVAVHGVVAADNRGYGAGALLAVLRQLLDEAFAGARVGVTAVHEAVQEHFLKTVLLGDIAEGENMVERGVHAAGRGQTHEVDANAVFFGVAESVFDFGVVENRAVGNGFVDFHEVLIYHAPCADVEVAYFRVAHLAVGEAHVFAGGLKFGVGIFFEKLIPVGGMGGVDGVALRAVADSPSVENHK